MKRGQGANGFTIIETLIVLAVTAALFLVAVLAVGGKQNETEFQQAINDAQSNMRKIINDVNSGDYQTASNLNCMVSGGTFTISLDTTSTSSTEGSHAGCEFLGRVVQFGLNSNSNEMIIYPVAGLQCLNGQINGLACDGSIGQVQPSLVAPANSGDTTPDTSTTTKLEYGLSVDHVNYVSGATTKSIGAVGFISGIGNYSGGQLASGTQQIALVPILNTITTVSDSMKAVKDIEGSPSPTNIIASYNAVAGSSAAYSVQICLASGTTKQSGLIIIGETGNNSLNAVSTKIFSNKTCS
jgi:type II secretory pathway pseudopilin PulG